MIVRPLLLADGGRRSREPMQVPDTGHIGVPDGIRWALPRPMHAITPTAAWTLSAHKPAILWGTTSTLLDVPNHAYVLFAIEGADQLYAIAQEDWPLFSTVGTTATICPIAWVDSHHDLTPLLSIILPLVECDGTGKGLYWEGTPARPTFLPNFNTNGLLDTVHFTPAVGASTFGVYFPDGTFVALAEQDLAIPGPVTGSYPVYANLDGTVVLGSGGQLIAQLTIANRPYEGWVVYEQYIPDLTPRTLYATTTYGTRASPIVPSFTNPILLPSPVTGTDPVDGYVSAGVTVEAAIYSDGEGHAIVPSIGTFYLETDGYEPLTNSPDYRNPLCALLVDFAAGYNLQVPRGVQYPSQGLLLRYDLLGWDFFAFGIYDGSVHAQDAYPISPPDYDTALMTDIPGVGFVEHQPRWWTGVPTITANSLALYTNTCYPPKAQAWVNPAYFSGGDSAINFTATVDTAVDPTIWYLLIVDDTATVLAWTLHGTSLTLSLPVGATTGRTYTAWLSTDNTTVFGGGPSSGSLSTLPGSWSGSSCSTVFDHVCITSFTAVTGALLTPYIESFTILPTDLWNMTLTVTANTDLTAGAWWLALTDETATLLLPASQDGTVLSFTLPYLASVGHTYAAYLTDDPTRVVNTHVIPAGALSQTIPTGGIFIANTPKSGGDFYGPPLNKRPSTLGISAVVGPGAGQVTLRVDTITDSTVVLGTETRTGLISAFNTWYLVIVTEANDVVAVLIPADTTGVPVTTEVVVTGVPGAVHKYRALFSSSALTASTDATADTNAITVLWS